MQPLGSAFLKHRGFRISIEVSDDDEVVDDDDVDDDTGGGHHSHLTILTELDTEPVTPTFHPSQRSLFCRRPGPLSCSAGSLGDAW